MTGSATDATQPYRLQRRSPSVASWRMAHTVRTSPHPPVGRLRERALRHEPWWGRTNPPDTGRSAVPHIRILGSLEVWAQNRRLVLGGPRQNVLLACLLVHANRAVSSDELIDMVWGEQRAGNRKRLQMAVVRLRQALAPADRDGTAALRTVHGGYLLSVATDDLDASLFRTMVTRGQRAVAAGDPERARELLRRALALWRGPALAESRYHDFALPEIRRLDELHLTAIESRFDAELVLGHGLQLVDELAACLAEHPTSERLACQLMLALYRCGRQGDALDVYQRVRTHLASELGLTPGPMLTEFQQRVLTQDLAAPPSFVLHRHLTAAR